MCWWWCSSPVPSWCGPGLYFHTRKHSGDEFNRDYVAILFFLLACASIWTEIIGVHAFFGAFAFGVCVPKEHGLVEYLAPKIELLIVEFFLPLYFANSGLSTQLGTLNTGALWGKVVALILIATVAKMGPVTLMTRLTSTIFFVNTVDPDEFDGGGGVDAESARSAKDTEMEERGEQGVMEVGEELEMVEIINKQHAEMAEMGGRMEKGTLGVIVDDGPEDDLEVDKAAHNDDEEKRVEDTRSGSAAAPPPPLFVNTGPGDLIPIDSTTLPSASSSSDEHKEEPTDANADEDDSSHRGEEREGSQLSRRPPRHNRSEEGSGVHFQDPAAGSSSSSAEHSLGKVIAHPTLSGHLVRPQLPRLPLLHLLPRAPRARAHPVDHLVRRHAHTPPPHALLTRNQPSSLSHLSPLCFDSLSIGVLMNTRGLVALIALNIGLQKGILGPKVFALMVLMALITTFITSPVFEWIFYKPYMAAKRAKREERRREAQAQRRLESGAGLAGEEEEESELQRTARLRKEEQEEEKARDEELSRMTIMVHSTMTPRSQAHLSYFPQTPRSPDERPEFMRAHTIGALPTGPRSSLSGKMAVPLHSLYYPHDAEHYAYTRTGVDHSFHLPPGGRWGRGPVELQHRARQAGPRGWRGPRQPVHAQSHADAAQPHGRWPTHLGQLPRPPPPLHRFPPPFRPLARQRPTDRAQPLPTCPQPLRCPPPPSAKRPVSAAHRCSSTQRGGLEEEGGGSPVHALHASTEGLGEGRQLQSQLLHTGPSRLHMMGDINVRPTAEETPEEAAEEDEDAGAASSSTP